MKKIVIIGGALAPYFNESMANQVHILSKTLNAQVVTCNDIGLLPVKKMGRYLIINSKYLLNNTFLLSLINGVVLYLIIKIYDLNSDIIIIPGGLRSKFIEYLNPTKCIPIVSSIPVINNDDVQKIIRKYAPRFRGIIVQSDKTKNQLISLGIEPSKITLMYPLIDRSKFRYSDPPELNIFKILFASSPNLEVLGEDNFKDKGVLLLLEAFRELIKDVDALLYIVWRGKYNEDLYHTIEKLNMENNVKVVDMVVDMKEMYGKTHATVIPYMNLSRSPEIPLSAVESLACGRPVVTTNVGEIAKIVTERQCGCVVKPDVQDLITGLKDCRDNYETYQVNCCTCWINNQAGLTQLAEDF